MSIPGHVHVSERESDGSWENCTECSGLEFYRDAIDSSVPATHAEAEALRAASGRSATGGSNLGDFRKAVLARYHKTLPPAISAHNILTALKPGYCSTVQGSMRVFASNHRLSVYDSHFDGTHAVYLARMLDGTLLWCDPEAPTSANVPVVVSAAEVGLFVNAFNGEAIVAPIKSLQVKEPANVDLVTYTPGVTADVKPASNVRSEPRIAATKLHATTALLPVQAIGTVNGDKDPANGSTVWYALWHAADKRVEYTAKDNVINMKPAAIVPGYPDVRPALAEAQAALSASTKARLAAEASLDGVTTRLNRIVARINGLLA